MTKNKYFQKNFDYPLDRTSWPICGSRPTVCYIKACSV